ncbi:MAG: hypothetical protein Q8O53_01080 [Candidatus Moranbacteria bacterium]|nr:hypothetical protein [Candidatus Moranbacteria bacterium]
MNEEQINKSWKKFNIIFWTGLLINVLASVSLLLFLSPESFNLIFTGLIISLFLLCGSLGYYAYIFSGKKRNLIVGVFGVPIMGPIIVLVGYFFVRGFKKKLEGASASENNSIK